MVRMWMKLKRCVSCVWVIQRGNSGDGCVLASTLRKGDLFVLGWASVRRDRRGSISSELLMCDGGVRSILLLPLVTRCLETIDVCMAHVCFYVYCSDCVGVCGNDCCVSAVVENSVFFCLGVLKYVVCLCRGCDGCCVFCLYCDACNCRCSCVGSVSVSSCRCCMFASCVHPVAGLSAAFCMTCSLLMLVEDARGDHMEEAYSEPVS